ncbi:hypothetical protein [Flavobacterium sp.]|uniref:hypothetical protein n=1 Tax=Flavobacterium sp. TaxID=239 RepID=UPI0028BF4506|nr:hypothetical protein [Flavobacterium sp.]
MGIIFTLVSIAFLPIAIFFSTQKEAYEKYDYSKIAEQGTEITGKIVDIQQKTNVSMNDKHPFVITYEFIENGKSKSDKFQTLDHYKVNSFSIGSNLTILSYNNQSVIKGLEPFSFPFYFLFIFPFMLIGLVPALKNYSLYKNGIVKEAKILSMTPNSGMPISNFGQSILVNYVYPSRTGKSIYGKSSTTDFSILNEKKADDLIKILVSETNEEQSCLIPKIEAIKNNWKI